MTRKNAAGKEKIELLAPAGSWEALEAAVNAGADAVYLGGRAFGARAYASNFDFAELERAVYFAHLHGVRLYVTVNTLVDDGEMAELAAYLCFLNNIGVDGIIVQDLGVVRLARLLTPELPLHASTQMTLTNSGGVIFAAALGMRRSVLARELSLAEIRAACAIGEEIECFIHGALCICYSGQCLMSSLIGGRSGNRGRCAQPCRLPYQLLDADGNDLCKENKIAVGQYLLSTKDLNTLAILPQLIESGVVSFKIEGRMKRPEYVAIVVDIYRRAIDSYLEGNYQVSALDKANIEQIFNRDFTTAYLLGRPGRALLSDRRPNNRGVLIGRVTKLDKKHSQAAVKLEKALEIGDVLEFWVKVGGRAAVTVTSLAVGGVAVERAARGETVSIAVPDGVCVNDRVFRTLDIKLMQYAETFCGADAKRRIPVRALVAARLGEPLAIRLTDADGNSGSASTNFLCEAARKRPLGLEQLRKQLARLGSTEYQLAEVDFQHDEAIMVPLSEINEARRQACAALDKARLAAFAKPRPEAQVRPELLILPPSKRTPAATQLTVHCDTIAKIEAAIAGGAERILFGGDLFSGKALTEEDYCEALQLCRGADRKIAFATARIVNEAELAAYEKIFTFWQDLAPDFLYLENLGLWPAAQKLEGIALWCGLSFNTFNSQSLAFWAEQGARGATLSAELTMAQLEKLAQVSPLPLEVLVQGRLEMMVSEYSPQESFRELLPLDQRSQALFLSDRKAARFPLVQDQAGRLHILNAYDLSVAANLAPLVEAGFASLRLDGRSYTPAQVLEYTRLYRTALAGNTPSENIAGTTRGHYFRGVF